MEAGTETKENNNGNCGICDNSLDDLFDHCDCKDGAPNMGSL